MIRKMYYKWLRKKLIDFAVWNEKFNKNNHNCSHDEDVDAYIKSIKKSK